MDWTLATVRQNAKRALRKKFPESSQVMSLIQVFVGLLSVIYGTQPMFTDPGLRLTVDDLAGHEEMLNSLAIGDLDKWKSSAFLA